MSARKTIHTPHIIFKIFNRLNLNKYCLVYHLFIHSHKGGGDYLCHNCTVCMPLVQHMVLQSDAMYFIHTDKNTLACVLYTPSIWYTHTHKHTHETWSHKWRSLNVQLRISRREHRKRIAYMTYLIVLVLWCKLIFSLPPTFTPTNNKVWNVTTTINIWKYVWSRHETRVLKISLKQYTITLF